jgi:transcriptional regulator with XRE-family HTH domain
MEFKDNLKHLRENAGYKQAKDFAKAAGIPYSSYATYERGSWPNEANLTRIALTLHASIDELLGYVPRNAEDNANRIINQYRAIGAIVSKNTIGKGFIVQIGPNRYRIESEEDLAFVYDKAMGEEMLIKCIKPIKITFLEMELCKYGAF